ncbi:hypothetical protein I4U23_027078 [Adineta vaga]|nr:hypothetical protein I4U23_027078 [Adineta vaga]
MKDDRISTGKVRIERISRRDQSALHQRSSSLKRNTSVKHISVRSTTHSACLSSKNKNTRDNDKKNLPNDQISQRSEKSSCSKIESARSTRTVHSVRVTKIHRVQSEVNEKIEQENSNNTSMEHSQVETKNNLNKKSNLTKQNIKKRVIILLIFLFCVKHKF